MPHLRSAIFVSDRTGITAEALGNTLLTQFDTIEFKRETIPFVDTVEKAQEVAEMIRQRTADDHQKPVVFTSIVNAEVRQALRVDHALVIDFFEAFIGELEAELHQKATLSVGKAHGMMNESQYDHRIEAVNYSLNHDDGVKLKDLHEADVILVGVSRTSKTPTCIYLAHRGVRAANVPLVPGRPLPEKLFQIRSALIVGLLISPDRLIQIRRNRLLSLKETRDTSYTDQEAVREEIINARRLYERHGWPTIDVTRRSVEETAAAVLNLLSRGHGQVEVLGG